MRILGLDLSLTSTGYCLIENVEPALDSLPRVVWFGSVGSALLRDAERLAMFDTWIRKELRDKRFQHVAIEGYSFASQFRGPQLGELGGVIKLAIHQGAIPMTVVPPASWKKALCGKGNLDKRNASVEISKRYGVSFASEDVLDAWAVAMYVRRQLLGLDKPEPKTRKPRVSAGKQSSLHMEAALDEKSAPAARRATGAAAS